jgi:transcriptional regulator with XRE-family HTH domain
MELKPTEKIAPKTQNDIAREAKITPAALSLILTKNRIPGPQTAKRLEQATGINRLVWMYPDEFGANPLMKKD